MLSNAARAFTVSRVALPAHIREHALLPEQYKVFCAAPQQSLQGVFNIAEYGGKRKTGSQFCAPELELDIGVRAVIVIKLL